MTAEFAAGQLDRERLLYGIAVEFLAQQAHVSQTELALLGEIFAKPYDAIEDDVSKYKDEHGLE